MTVAPSKNSDQAGHRPCLISLCCQPWETFGSFAKTGWLPRLICVLAGSTCHFVGFFVLRLIYLCLVVCFTFFIFCFYLLSFIHTSVMCFIHIKCFNWNKIKIISLSWHDKISDHLELWLLKEIVVSVNILIAWDAVILGLLNWWIPC